MAGLRLTDMETGYKVFRREVLTGLNFQQDRFGIEPELTAKIAARGWRILEVLVSYRPRTVVEGKKIGWRDGVRALFCIFRYSRGSGEASKVGRRRHDVSGGCRRSLSHRLPTHVDRQKLSERFEN